MQNPSTLFFASQDFGSQYEETEWPQLQFVGVFRAYKQKVMRIEPKPKILTNTKNEGYGKWTLKEQKRYIKYLKQNLGEMNCKLQRKVKKVFIRMSAKIRSRTADQCRSHHQKILKYHDTLEKIIKHYENIVFPACDSPKGAQQQIHTIFSSSSQKDQKKICQQTNFFAQAQFTVQISQTGFSIQMAEQLIDVM